MKKINLNEIKNESFKIPDNYFENLEERILNELTDEGVNHQFGKSGFKVPDNYFEDVESSIISKALDKKTKVIGLSPVRLISAISAVAASLLLIFFLKPDNDANLRFSDLSLDVIDSYFYDEEIETEELAQLLNVSAETIESADIKFADNQYIEDYLIENLDTQDLILVNDE